MQPAARLIRPLSSFLHRWQHIGWLLLLPLAIPALWPFYREGLPRSFDGGLHMLRIGLLDHYIRQGYFLPRWAPNLLLGYGYPLFNFYAPGAYYLVEVLHLAGLAPYAAFIAAFAVIVLAAGLGMFYLAHDIFGRERFDCALVAAVAYLYAPYLMTNVYIRGAIAEAAAQALLPWILWSARRLWLSGDPARYALPLALTLGALALTHNITLLFLPPFLLGYLFVLWWRSGRNLPALGWSAFALLGAMGISAFFWLPLLAERNMVAGTGYEIARSVWLPSSVWRWHNFLDGGLTFEHTFERPVRIGLVQLLLGIGGFLAALVPGKWRDVEWLFLGLVALITGASMGAWALPLWQNNDILPVAQFTWRLLSILSLPLALFSGGLLLWLHGRWWRILAAAALLALMIVSSQPRLSWMDTFAPQTVEVSVPLFAQLEIEQGAMEASAGVTMLQEFRPRWADRSLTLQAEDKSLPAPDFRLESANPFGLSGTYSSQQPSVLRFSHFYFPGWRVVLDESLELEPYPSTNLGLLTVDLPEGTHRLELTWQETPIQQWASLISLAALALLLTVGLITFRSTSHSLLAWVGIVLVLAIGARFVPPRPATLIQPPNEINYGGLRLLGYRLEQGPDSLTIYPYWQVDERAAPGLRMRWSILDSDGKILAGVTNFPYFNTSSAHNWPAGAVVDDGYRLPLPPALPAGEYQLGLQFGYGEGDFTSHPWAIGNVTIDKAVAPQEAPAQPVDARIGENMQLAGYSLRTQGRDLPIPPEKPAVVHSGDYLETILYWRATGMVAENYHGFVHLLDHNGQPLAQQDQLPGPFFRPPRLWDESRLQEDVYLLRLPATTPGGLYWPTVGLYEFESLKRLPVYLEGQEEPGDHVRLPALKVVNRQKPRPQHPLDIHFGDVATLAGYDLALPDAGLHPGDRFAVTLYFHSKGTTEQEYIRFIQLYAAERGMAAQFDSPPQGGGNPTWSWQPDEWIVDRVELQVSTETAPGTYTLYTGFYEAQAPSTRLPVTDAEGQPIPEAWFPIAGLEVVAAGMTR